MSERKPKYYYLTAALLAVLLFGSNFLSTDLFKDSLQNFAVWVVLSIFCFACGWLIDKTLEWNVGGKVIFAVVVATVVFTVIFVSVFSDYFGINDLLTESLILYSLRNTVLGAMAFFGMAQAEVMDTRQLILDEKEKRETMEAMLSNARKESELLVKEAKLEADKIVSEANGSMTETKAKQKRIEEEIKNLVLTERELIRKYELEGEE